MKRATLTADAKRELEEIWVFIALDNEPAADHIIDRMYDAFFPIGRVSALRPGCWQEMREAYTRRELNTVA
jgi:plasmid stabilization system protein ParE